MHVLVTGATGFVGLHTTLALLRAGHSVRLSVRNADKMQQLFRARGIEVDDFHVGEITDRSAVDQALEGCDAVIHTAALVSLDPSQAALMYKTNVTGTRRVIGGAVEQGIRSIIHVSSAAALFDPARSRIDENTPLATPRSAYARSKADAENYVRELIDQGAPVTITYPTGVIGPDDPATSEGNQSLLFILNRFHVHTSSGIQVIDVRDLAAALVTLLESQARGRYLVAGHYTPWRELGQLLERITERRLLKVPAPGPVLRAVGQVTDLVSRIRPVALPISSEAMNLASRWVICDDSKLRQETGLRHRPLEETLADTVRWLAHSGHVHGKWAAGIRD